MCHRPHARSTCKSFQNHKLLLSWYNFTCRFDFWWKLLKCRLNTQKRAMLWNGPVVILKTACMDVVLTTHKTGKWRELAQTILMSLPCCLQSSRAITRRQEPSSGLGDCGATQDPTAQILTRSKSYQPYSYTVAAATLRYLAWSTGVKFWNVCRVLECWPKCSPSLALMHWHAWSFRGLIVILWREMDCWLWCCLELLLLNCFRGAHCCHSVQFLIGLDVILSSVVNVQWNPFFFFFFFFLSHSL